MFHPKSEDEIILPVCSCGYVFKDLTYSCMIDTSKEINYPIECFTPLKCPNCNGRITTIVLKPGKIEVEVE